MFGSFYRYPNMGRMGFEGCSFLGADWWSRGLMIGLVLIGITIIVLLAIHVSRQSSNKKYANEDAVLILKKRYAQGEITHEEFESMKEKLQRR